MNEAEIAELKKEFQRVIDCCWEVQFPGRSEINYYRAAFRVTPETMQRWKEIST